MFLKNWKIWIRLILICIPNTDLDTSVKIRSKKTSS
jgi:hypothetical protein